jgi:hypothetical protein
MRFLTTNHEEEVKIGMMSAQALLQEFTSQDPEVSRDSMWHTRMP